MFARAVHVNMFARAVHEMSARAAVTVHETFARAVHEMFAPYTKCLAMRAPCTKKINDNVKDDAWRQKLYTTMTIHNPILARRIR